MAATTNPVSARGSSKWAANQIALSAGSAQVAPASATRQRVTILNTGLVNVFLSHQANPTSVNGCLLVPGASRVFTNQGAIYGAVASGTGAVDVQDESD